MTGISSLLEHVFALAPTLDMSYAARAECAQEKNGVMNPQIVDVQICKHLLAYQEATQQPSFSLMWVLPTRNPEGKLWTPFLA